MVDCPGYVGSAFLRFRDPDTAVPARTPDLADGFNWAALEFERLPPPASAAGDDDSDFEHVGEEADDLALARADSGLAARDEN